MNKTELPTVDENPERCETCRYFSLWSPEDGDECDYGYCYRHAPTPRWGRSPSLSTEATLWPSTDRDEWCGEWRAKRIPTTSEG